MHAYDTMRQVPYEERHYSWSFYYISIDYRQWFAFLRLGNTCVMLLTDSNFTKFIDYKINTGYKIYDAVKGIEIALWKHVNHYNSCSNNKREICVNSMDFNKNWISNPISLRKSCLLGIFVARRYHKNPRIQENQISDRFDCIWKQTRRYCIK